MLGADLRTDAKDVVLSPLPLFHSYGLNLSVLSVLAIGASEHIMEKFSPQQALELLQSGKYTVFPGVPTMFHYLLHRAQESGVERLGECPAMHLGRRDHAGDVEPGVRGALQDAAARRLRHHRDFHDGHDELAEWRAADGIVRTAGAGPCRAHRRSVVAGRRSASATRAN